MLKNKVTLVLVLLALSTLMFTASAKFSYQSTNGRGASGQKQSIEERVKDRLEFEAQFPVVKYDDPDPDNDNPEKRAKRKAKNQHYDKYSFGLSDPTPRVNETSIESEWSLHLDALPFAQSRLILIGEVINAGAHLSNNKKGIYSEFAVRASEILKDDGAAALSPGSVITIERVGGAVIYPAGNKRIIRVAGQGLPRINRRYVFFLGPTESGQDFNLLTGYELRLGKTFPLDESIRMSAYNELAEDAFLSQVREAIARTR